MGLDNPLHIALILVVVLLLFGARRLPEIGRSLGSGIREFKRSVTGESEQAAPYPGAAEPARPAPVGGAPVTAPLPAPGAQMAAPGNAEPAVAAPAVAAPTVAAPTADPAAAERGTAVAAADTQGHADTRAA
jgi:sec-independent protein translocase protein TatA